MRCVLVSHTHWDREWYREYQAFRARLVDAVDRLLDLCAEDPDYRFLLDGQSIALEDYAEIRPERIGELRGLVAAGRVAIGPWYVQPDSLLPAGESLVRNLLEGRRAGEAFGPVSRVAYTPDSFGHPAQFPQLFAGFGMRAFVYWRGHGDERDALTPEWEWQAPDGSRVLACHLVQGYFNAASDPKDPLDAVAAAVAGRARTLAALTKSGAVLLLNGIDHAPPEPRAGALAEAIARETGFAVERGTLEDFVDAVEEAGEARPSFTGDLLGARGAPLLPGVWSTRTWLKRANRECEAELLGFAEPLAALAERLGARAETAALRGAWRALLPNHAHDSICGCSIDAVHEQMRGRFDAARGLATETAARCQRALAGSPPRNAPWSAEWDVAVFNPSPHLRTDRVRIALDPDPWMAPSPNVAESIHPLLGLDPAAVSFTADGAPARVVAPPPGRVALAPERPGLDLELVARDVPALGWKRVRLRVAAERFEDIIEEVVPGGDDARIRAEDRGVSVGADGTLDVAFGDRSWRGLFAAEDVGDRGDSYDFDPVGDDDARGVRVAVRRITHPSGFAELEIERTLSVPARLAPDRETRSEERCEIAWRLRVALVPGVPRLDAELRVEDPARDHRLRVLFPLGADADACDAATAFDVCRRGAGPRPDAGWIQRAPDTFPCHGFAHAAGLTVAAPGLAEAAFLRREGEAALAFTLLRCVGHLSRGDLRTRPGPAGPAIATPGAQCPGRFTARFAVFPGLDPRTAADSELGLRALPCSGAGLQTEGVPGLEIAPREVVLSALKPADDGDGVILRLLNPTGAPQDAEVRIGFPFEDASECALDERPSRAPEGPPRRDGASLRLALRPHGLRSLRLR